MEKAAALGRPLNDVDSEVAPDLQRHLKRVRHLSADQIKTIASGAPPKEKQVTVTAPELLWKQAKVKEEPKLPPDRITSLENQLDQLRTELTDLHSELRRLTQSMQPPTRNEWKQMAVQALQELNLPSLVSEKIQSVVSSSKQFVVPREEIANQLTVSIDRLRSEIKDQQNHALKQTHAEFEARLSSHQKEVSTLHARFENQIERLVETSTALHPVKDNLTQIEQRLAGLEKKATDERGSVKQGLSQLEARMQTILEQRVGGLQKEAEIERELINKGLLEIDARIQKRQTELQTEFLGVHVDLSYAITLA